jgi:hypothetical protein
MSLLSAPVAMRFGNWPTRYLFQASASAKTSLRNGSSDSQQLFDDVSLWGPFFDCQILACLSAWSARSLVVSGCIVGKREVLCDDDRGLEARDGSAQ